MFHVLLCLLAVWLPCSTPSQKHRDHLNLQEADLVREAQEIDRRTEVFLKIADRRLKALEVLADPSKAEAPLPTDPKKAKKEQEKRAEEAEKWGPPPTGTRTELLANYQHVIEELEDKLDDAFDRDPKNALLNKAVGLLKNGLEAQMNRLLLLRKSYGDTLTRDEDRAMTTAYAIAQEALNGARTYLEQNPAPKKP